MNRKENDQKTNQIPEVDMIDLEEQQAEETDAQDAQDAQDAFQDDAPEKKPFTFRSLLNPHTAFFAVVIICIVVIVMRFQNWGIRVDLDEIFSDGQGTYDDTLDLFLPAPSPENSTAIEDDITTILFLGNSPFADDRDSEDNLVNMIAEQTGANVINCAVGDSYIAAQHVPFDAAVAPMDAYTLYWLTHLAIDGSTQHMLNSAAEVLGEDVPEEAAYVSETLYDLDLNTVDVVAIMYDATDYLLGHEMYSDSDNEDVRQFTGNLEASIHLLQERYPHLRFIVLSPTYAFALDENGEYVSSDMYRYGQDVLSTYVIKQYGSCAALSVTFIDNLYGTITEDNASEYLTDHLHLNVEGRKLVAERFVYALNRYQSE